MTDTPILRSDAKKNPATTSHDTVINLIGKELKLGHLPTEALITLAAFAGIEIAHSDVQAIVIGSLGAVALVIILLARLNKVI